MNKNQSPETINQILSFVSGVKTRIKNTDLRLEISEIESSLKQLKNSPELNSSCVIDFKISNPEYYIDKVREILDKNNLLNISASDQYTF